MSQASRTLHLRRQKSQGEGTNEDRQENADDLSSIT